MIKLLVFTTVILVRCLDLSQKALKYMIVRSVVKNISVRKS